MKTIAVVHFAPLELYPPVQNLIRELEKNDISVIVVSTTPVKWGKNVFVAGPLIKIVRFGKSGQRLRAVIRYINYIYHYLATLVCLVYYRPTSILYYETLSSFAVYLYKKYINSAVKLFIHYHEYTSPAEYNSGMKMANFFFQKERQLYASAEWVSHTNKLRMQLFLEDIKPQLVANPHLLPNYPPRSWSRPAKQMGNPVRLLYVGALSLTTMYTREFAEWVLAQKGKVTWHLYSSNFTKEVEDYFLDLKTDLIQLREGIPYENLPDIIKDYDVGVVLYRGHIPNYIYNEPNKLFEYLVCGLDVWFPQVMIGSLPYHDIIHYPKVISLDFYELNKLSLDELVKRPLHQRVNNYFCEEALRPLVDKLNA